MVLWSASIGNSLPPSYKENLLKPQSSLFKRFVELVPVSKLFWRVLRLDWYLALLHPVLQERILGSNNQSHLCLRPDYGSQRGTPPRKAAKGEMGGWSWFPRVQKKHLAVIAPAKVRRLSGQCLSYLQAKLYITCMRVWKQTHSALIFWRYCIFKRLHGEWTCCEQKGIIMSCRRT